MGKSVQDIMIAKRVELHETLLSHSSYCERCTEQVWTTGQFNCPDTLDLVLQITRLNLKIGLNALSLTKENVKDE